MMRDTGPRANRRRTGARPIRTAPVLLVGLWIAGCTGTSDEGAIPGESDTLEGAAPATVRADLDEEFSLSYGESAVVGPERLTIKFRRLAEESRCPQDVQCPTVGNAAAELAVETADGAAATLTLNTHRPPREAPAPGHRIRLAGLVPWPRTAEAPLDTADYAVSLRVTEEE
ncbi:MAG: hypothetical protein KY397_04700 [Gemmatimonadetes bacterium]|nr:hypothetical protein [Gemmatimonadota bacterium]